MNLGTLTMRNPASAIRISMAGKLASVCFGDKEKAGLVKDITVTRDPDPVPVDAAARRAEIHPFGSGRGIHRGAGDGMAQRPADRLGLYSAWQALAQRLRPMLQRQAARRMPESGVVPGSSRGAGRGRILAGVL